VLTCYRTRKRIGAYLDGALEGAKAESAARHLAACAVCHREAEGLRKMRALLQQALSQARSVPEPDWADFWAGIVHGIEETKGRAPVQARRRVWLRPRWALGGALVAALVASMLFWESDPVPPALEAPVVVNSANSDYPGASLMVYHTPEHDMTVVWVFDLDE
jgi:anti-sigma factor RsiW